MKALIDLDPIVYAYSDMRFPDGGLMPLRMVRDRVISKIDSIVEKSGSDTWEGFLTFGPDNFRIKEATIKPYKGNRSNKERPPNYEYVRGFLSDMPQVKMVFGMEADDALSIAQCEDYSNQVSAYSSYAEDDPIERNMLGTIDEALSGWMCGTVICTVDKDLDMVPGLHYQWSKGNVEEKKVWYQTPIGGLRCFYKQCLIGDSVDNIPGLYGIGPKSAYVNQLDEMETEEEMVAHVLALYSRWYGSYASQFLTEVGRLLWMRQEPTQMWSIPNV